MKTLKKLWNDVMFKALFSIFLTSVLLKTCGYLLEGWMYSGNLL